MGCECSGSVCLKCHGVMKIVLGVLVLAWALWWPMLDWRLVLGGLLVIMGILKVIKPMCGHCKMSEKKKK